MLMMKMISDMWKRGKLKTWRQIEILQKLSFVCFRNKVWFRIGNYFSLHPFSQTTRKKDMLSYFIPTKTITLYPSSFIFLPLILLYPQRAYCALVTFLQHIPLHSRARQKDRPPQIRICNSICSYIWSPLGTHLSLFLPLITKVLNWIHNSQ